MMRRRKALDGETSSSVFFHAAIVPSVQQSHPWAAFGIDPTDAPTADGFLTDAFGFEAM